MRTIEGKKTILFDFMKDDFDYFFKLFKNGSHFRCHDLIYLGDEEQIEFTLTNYLDNSSFEMFLAKTMQGKNSRNVGVFMIEYKKDYIAKIRFIPDSKYISGLSKYLKGEKISYLEDALKAILMYLKDFKRLETKVPKSDVLMKKLFKKIGFKKEGILESYGNIDDNYFDVVIFGKVKE